MPGRQAPDASLDLSSTQHTRFLGLSTDLSSIRDFPGPSNISIVLPQLLPLSRAPARLLHALCAATTTTASPHIHAQPRASSRSRLALPRLARRAAHSHRRVQSLSSSFVVADPTPPAASPKGAFTCRALPLLSRHWARIPRRRPCVGRSLDSLLLARLASTVSSSRTHAISLQPPLGLQVPDHLHRLRSPSTSPRCHHTNSPTVRAPARNSV